MPNQSSKVIAETLFGLLLSAEATCLFISVYKLASYGW